MKSLDAISADTRAAEPGVADFWALMKPRVMSLSIFTALVGMLAAPTTPHPLVALAALLCIAAGAGASGALNMWWDADIDRRMRRTRGRPIPAGRATPEDALGLGVGVSVMAVSMLAVFANLLSAALLAFTIFFYVVVYTMWLKRSTPQNIVIGGAAGALPPMIGWAAATGDITAAPVLMFLLIFLWTPPHFWALALWRSDDYAEAKVPMLPVTAGPRETRRQILLYSLILAPASLALAFTEAGGVIYLVVALTANAAFLAAAWRVFARSQGKAEADRFAAEKRLFGVSLVYLFALFAALLIEAGARAAGLGLALPIWIG